MIKNRGRTLEGKFEKCIISNKEKFYKLAFMYVKNQHDALDILQDSILKGYSNLNKLKDSNAIDKWFSRIIINTAIDFIRKNSKIMLVDDSNIEMDNLLVDGDKELLYLVDNLEEELKSVIILKYYHGYTINEVAEILAISVSTVKNRIHKALNVLRVEIVEV